MPTQAEQCLEFLTQVWEIKSTPTPDGGVTITRSDQYDEKWVHARDTIRLRFNGKQAGYYGQDVYYRFPDQSTIGTDINGTMAYIPKTHRSGPPRASRKKNP